MKNEMIQAGEIKKLQVMMDSLLDRCENLDAAIKDALCQVRYFTYSHEMNLTMDQIGELEAIAESLEKK